jgi:hypothetical protein
MTTKRLYDFGDVIVAWLPWGQLATDEDCCIVVDADTDPVADPESVDGDRHVLIVVSAAKHNKAGQKDITVLQCTSRTEKARARGEYVLKRWAEANFHQETAIRPKIYMIVKSEIIYGGPIGQIHPDDIEGVRGTLRDLLAL